MIDSNRAASQILDLLGLRSHNNLDREFILTKSIVLRMIGFEAEEANSPEILRDRHAFSRLEKILEGYGVCMVYADPFIGFIQSTEVHRWREPSSILIETLLP